MRPKAFLGSSSEAIKYANAVTTAIGDSFDITLWNASGAFTPSNFTLESLLRFTDEFDYGIFIMTADDMASIRKQKHSITRDNVIFEAGLFFGALGRANCFLLVSDDKKLHLPSDLQGLTYIPFREKRGQLPDSEARKRMAGPCRELQNLCKKRDGSGLNGRWQQTWFVENSEHYPKKNSSDAEVGVFGSRFRAEFDTQGFKYKLVARINEKRMITGVWCGPHESSYHGSCQLTVSPDSKSISGKWVGFRANNEVEAGQWKWSRR